MEKSIKIIEVSNENEYQNCLDIRHRVFVKEQNIAKELEVDCFEKESKHFLALFDKKAVATGRFRLYKNFLKFERIAVIKSMRGKKIGSILMQEMQKRGFEKYPNYLQVIHSQVNALKFYKKLGWVEIGKPFEEANVMHLLMIFLHDRQCLLKFNF